MPTINVSPAASADDGAARDDNNASAFTGSQTLDYLNWSTTAGGLYYTGYIRFPNITIPQSAIITAASVEFEADASHSTTTVNIDIYGGDVDSASQPANSAAVTGATPTTATVPWDNVPPFTAGSTYTTPDIATIIQEIVNRGGWLSGNALILYFNLSRSSVNQARRPAAWDSASRAAPVLSITYSAVQEIEGGTIASTATVYTPGVAAGAVEVGANAIASTVVVNQPSVDLGNPILSPGTISSTVAINEPAIEGGSLVYQIAAGGQDGDQDGIDDQATLRFGYDETDSPLSIFLHFPDVSIQPGHAIDPGTILILTSAANLSDAVQVQIQAVTGGSPQPPANSTEFSNLPLTTASVAWFLSSAWADEEIITTQSIEDVLQELVDVGDATDGVLLVISPVEGFGDGYREIAAFDHPSTAIYPPAQLIINATEAGSQLIEMFLAPAQGFMYEPAAVPGSVEIETEAITNTAVVNAHLVAQQQFVESNTIANAATLNDPSVEAGAVTVEANAITSTATINQPAAIPGDVAVEASHIDSTESVNQPTVVPDQFVEANAIASTAAPHQSSIDTYTMVEAETVDSTLVLYQPAAVWDAVIEPGAIDSTLALFDPEVLDPVIGARMHTIASTAEAYDPAVSPGPVTMALNAIASTLELHEPEITTHTTIALNTLAKTLVLYSPTVIPGEIVVPLGELVNLPVLYRMRLRPVFGIVHTISLRVRDASTLLATIDNATGAEVRVIDAGELAAAIREATEIDSAVRDATTIKAKVRR